MEASGVNRKEPEEEQIINCVAIFYDEGKSGEDFRKKNKFRCKVNKSEKRLVKLRENLVNSSSLTALRD